MRKFKVVPPCTRLAQEFAAKDHQRILCHITGNAGDIMKATGFTAVFTFLLKIIALLELLIGLGFVIFGCVLETPPKTPVPA